MAEEKLTIIRGDSQSIDVVFEDDAGVKLNLTGKTVFFTVKKQDDLSANDDNALIKKTVTVHSDPTNGKTTIALSATDTDIEPANYFYDLQVKNGADIMSTEKSYLEIISDITRRTT